MSEPHAAHAHGDTAALDDRQFIKHEIEHFAHLLPEQQPMNRTFVHTNPMLALELHGWHFKDALKEGARLTGGRQFISNEDHRAHYARGRITDGNLAESFRRQKALVGRLDEVLATVADRQIKFEEVIHTHMVHGIEPLEAGFLPYEVFQNNATRVFRADVPEAARKALSGKAEKDLAAGLARIGVDWTFADWIVAHTGLNLSAHLRVHSVVQLASNSGKVAPQKTEVSLKTLGIPAERSAGYLARVDKEFAGLNPRPTAEQAEQLRALWLQAEASLIDGICRRHFGVAGTLAALRDHYARDLEAYAVLSLWSASLGRYGLQDPLSPTDPNHFLERDPESGMTEAIAEQFRHMERWGGPPMPIDAELRARIEALVRKELASYKENAEKGDPAALEIAHLCWIIMHDLSVDHVNRRGLEAVESLLSITNQEEHFADLLHQLQHHDPRKRMLAYSAKDLGEQLASLATGRAHTDFLKAVTGEDLVEKVNRYMIRIGAAFLDEGMSAWRMPGRPLGLYDAWRNLALHERCFDFDDLTGWRDALHHMPTLADDAVIHSLTELGVPREHWGEYCGRVLFRLKGFAGMFNWHALNRGEHEAKMSVKALMHPVEVNHYLAIRLFYETLLVKKTCKTIWQIDGSAESLKHYFASHPAEYLVRRDLYAGHLPDYLAEDARRLVADKHYAGGDEDDQWKSLADKVWAWRQSDASDLRDGVTVYRESWRLFHLAQLLGISGAELRALPDEQVKALIDVLDFFPASEHGYTWLQAFEFNYRDRWVNALVQNRNRGYGRWKTRDRRPKAQLVVCMDEREESLHRGFEEIDPDYETFGVPGFIGFAIDYMDMDDHESRALCPVPRFPEHRIHEVARDSALHTTFPQHKKRVRWMDAFHNAYWEAKRNPVASYFLIDLVGFVMALPLIGRIFAPVQYFKTMGALKNMVVPQVETMVTASRIDAIKAEEYGLDTHGKPIGFTDAEAADRLEMMMQNWGMHYNFGDFVIICMHGSNSENNPHENAHDCGACSGKHSYPNARTFSKLANKKEVRDILRGRGIDITDATWFVGGERNTASSLLTWYDLQDIPADKQAAWKQVSDDLELMVKKDARERCRRFGSSPKDASLEASHFHTQHRAKDFSQVRPEWGHCTNATAIVGRSCLSSGVYFDRRKFDITYDPRIDPEGKILARVLNAAGPVGAGISLEYYFSTVDPTVWGCDTKVPHNVTGQFGVMPGAHSDLLSGLPRQMTEIHEAQRLMLVVDGDPNIIAAVYMANPTVTRLLDGEWIYLIVHDMNTGKFLMFIPGVGFEDWEEKHTAQPIPEVSESFEWYKGKHECYIGPALITPIKARKDQSRRS